MKSLKQAKSISAPSPAHFKKSNTTEIEPVFPELSSLPETLADLFRALALTVTTTVNQPDPKGEKSAKKQDYALPWVGFTSWHDARQRLDHFERTFTGDIGWAPFNDSVSNDGPMSLNAYPGRAFIERVTNEGDANLERAALSHKGAMPKSPSEASELWFGLGPGSLSKGLSDEKVRDLAQTTVTVSGFVGNSSDPKDSIFDARDFGIGLTADEMPSTILSLNRGNKKSKPYLTGKHGQGASSTYQYTDLTLIASRKVGAKTVAFTLVEATWDSENGTPAKTPTYRYLTVDGKVPEIDLPEAEFAAGTLVRHIGYNAADLFNPVGENSLYGLLMRSLAQPLFPVWLQIYSLRPSKAEGYPTFTGYRRYGRLLRGSVNALERAWSETLKSGPTDELESTVPEDQPDASTEADVKESSRSPKILHRASEYYQLPQWDYGARTGVGELGRVRITYWVVEPNGRSSNEVLRNWVDPEKTILMTLDGQTHAEESRAIVTGNNGARLWAVGRYLIVQIDCDELDPRAKYEMFTSTREHAKETPIKKMILEELVNRLSYDTKLKDLNVHLAAADVKTSSDTDQNISSMIKKYLKAIGVNFDQITRKIEKWVEVDGTKYGPEQKPEPPPIAAVEPPTYVRWKFKGTSVSIYPGQRYSAIFETDAAPSYWNPADQTNSRIKVLAHGLQYVGSGDMKGGRVRCHFICPEDAAIGAKGYIQVQLDYALGAAKTHTLPVEIVERPKPKPKVVVRPTPSDEKDNQGEGRKIITVKIRKKDFTEVEIPVVKPIPVKRDDPGSPWMSLGWPLDSSRVGFSIRALGGKIQLYYNAEFPPFLEMRRRMSKKSLETEFVQRYELKLVLHTIFTLNYDFVDEEEFKDEQKKQVRDLLCSTAESLALATKSELEIESRLKSEETAPLETPVVASVQDSVSLPS